MLTLTTTHFRQVLKTPMTTDSFSLFVKNTVSIFQDPATAFVTRFTLNDSVYRVKTLIGSDSHTPTGGGIGMLAIGAGGLDVAVAMGGGAYYITMPENG